MQDSFFNHEIEDKVLKALIMQFESLLSLNFWVSRKEREGALPSQTNGNFFFSFLLFKALEYLKYKTTIINYYNKNNYFSGIFMFPDVFQIKRFSFWPRQSDIN